MNARVVPTATVPWKWPGIANVLWRMMFNCICPTSTPVVPPMNPNRAIEKNVALNPGSDHGAWRSQPNQVSPPMDL